MKYKVWFIPTKKGIQHFGWKHKLIKEFDNKEDADEFAYIESADDPAPDSSEYGNYKVISSF